MNDRNHTRRGTAITHVVFASQCRTKRLHGELRRELGQLLHRLALQKECRIEEGRLMLDHVHMPISIPSKYSISNIAGLKGKTALYVANNHGRPVSGRRFQWFKRGAPYPAHLPKEKKALRGHR